MLLEFKVSLKQNKITKEVTNIKEIHTIKHLLSIKTFQNSHMEDKKRT
jgi:hypothetical protein